MNFAAKNGMYLKHLLTEICAAVKRIIICAPLLLGDCQAANLIGAASASVRAVRHLTLAIFFTRNLVQNGLAAVRSISTSENSSDILTKVLSEEALARLCRLVNLRELNTKECQGEGV